VKKEAGFIFMVALRNIQKERKDKVVGSSAALGKVGSGTLRGRGSVSSLKMDFKDLYILCKLGEGQMGKVLLVENKKT
jgi:serine/threonine protein kinase